MSDPIELRDAEGELAACVEQDALELVVLRPADIPRDVIVDLTPLEGHRFLRRIVVRAVKDAYLVGSALLPTRLDELVWLEVHRGIENPEVVPNFGALRVLDAGAGAVATFNGWERLKRLERPPACRLALSSPALRRR